MESRKEDILHTADGRKANWIGHILRRNCIPKHVIEGEIDVTGRRGRRRKHLLDYLKKKRGYWKLKEEALDGTLCRTRFGRGYGPVLRQITV
jgi:predicted AlkP superfamily pyrophosphatase or phosphodiesterase